MKQERVANAHYWAAKIMALILFAVAEPTLGLAQGTEDGILYWHRDSVLRKEHFRSLNEVDGVSAQSALNTLIHRQDEVVNSLTFAIQAFFVPEESWFLPNQGEIIDSLVLFHEQIHFDIEELFARRLKRRIYLECQDMHRHNFPTCRDKIYSSLEFDKDKMNEQFHFDILVPDFIKVERFWKEKVRKQLEELKEFENTEIRIRTEP
ncbi:MAG: hypothetical protein KBF73_09905 [Flavobacteriales bacterium]|nr:hypothetical protein [Flavobacteriales bacterium]